jgi:hypothetical protein
MKKEDIENDYDVKHQKFNFKRGYPFAPNLFYECLECNELVHSAPKNCVACSCRNIIVDADAGRMAVRDDSQIRLVKLLAKSSKSKKLW